MAVWNGARPIEVLTFGLQGELFALEATYVREILDMVPMTEVPNADPFVNGLINVRGKVVPVSDLRLKFGMDQAASTIDTRIVVIEVVIDDEPAIVGLRADKVYEITEIPATALEEAPKVGMRWRPDYVLCVAKRDADFIVVLNIERIFAASEFRDDLSPAMAAAG
jgi:purine-binding chemotaxis protein CheW